MSWGVAQGRENLSAVDNLESELPMKGFETVDLLSPFGKQGGSQIDLAMRLQTEFALKSALSSARVKVLTKLIGRPFTIPERAGIRRVYTIISRNDLSRIIKIGPSRNRSKIGV